MNRATYDRLTGLRLENDEAAMRQAEMRPRFERMANRHENGTAPRAVSAFQLFQTPPEIAARMVALLNLRHGERVLEPSAGLGRILDALQPYGLAEVVAVEIDATLAGELFRQARERVTLLQRDFLTMTPGEFRFDAVCMNPPFHMRADIEHVRHALTFLRPGGRLATLLLNTPHREVLRPMAASWEVLPAGVFGKEGTRVSTILATFNV